MGSLPDAAYSPGLGGVSTAGRFRSALAMGRWDGNRRGSVRLGYGDFLGLRSILSTMWTEDHAIELGNAGLVEAVGHTEVRVTLQKGALGKRKIAISDLTVWPHLVYISAQQQFLGFLHWPSLQRLLGIVVSQHLDGYWIANIGIDNQAC